MQASRSIKPKLVGDSTARSTRPKRSALPVLHLQSGSTPKLPSTRRRRDANPSFLNDSQSSMAVIQESRNLFLSRLSAGRRRPEHPTDEFISIDCEPAASDSRAAASSNRLLRSIREKVRLRNSKKQTDIKDYLAAICSFPEHQGRAELDERASLHRALEANFKRRDAVNKGKDLRSLAANPSAGELRIEVAPSLGQRRRLNSPSLSRADASVESCRQAASVNKGGEPAAKFPGSLNVQVNGVAVAVQSEQLNFLQLIGEVSALLDKLWKVLGARSSRILELFSLSVSKKNIIWEVMFDSNRQPKKIASITELLVLFLRYGLKASRASGVPRPLYLNPQVCEAIGRDHRPGHQAAQEVLNRVLAALEPQRINSTQFTIRGLNTSASFTDQPMLSRTTSIQLARNNSRLLTTPLLEIPESLRVDQVLTAQEVTEVFKFLEAGKLIVADLKAEHYQASFQQVASGIDKVGETRLRISESLQSVHRVWLRPFKADPNDHLPVKLGAAKSAAEAEIAAVNEGFIDPGLVANNGLLRDFTASLEVNSDYSPDLDIRRFLGINPSLNR